MPTNQTPAATASRSSDSISEPDAFGGALHLACSHLHNQSNFTFTFTFICHPFSQSVSYFTVPPRAHPSTGSQGPAPPLPV